MSRPLQDPLHVRSTVRHGMTWRCDVGLYVPVPAMILCGGQGTRLRDQTAYRPKPMVEIGGKPILWHIMQLYAHHEFTEFVLCLGYMGDVIKKFFLDYRAMVGDFTIRLDQPDGPVIHDEQQASPWSVTCADTGLYLPLLHAGRHPRVRRDRVVVLPRRRLLPVRHAQADRGGPGTGGAGRSHACGVAGVASRAGAQHTARPCARSAHRSRTSRKRAPLCEHTSRVRRRAARAPEAGCLDASGAHR